MTFAIDDDGENPEILESAVIDNENGFLTVLASDTLGSTTIKIKAADDTSPAPNVAYATFTVTVNDNLIQNGSFEQIVTPNPWNYIHAIPEWTLESGPNFELQKNLLQTSADGSQYLELDAHPLPGSTAVSQTVATKSGGAYRLRFAFSGRPGTTLAQNHAGVELFDVDAAGVETPIEFTLLEEVTGDAVPSNQPQLDPATNPGWRYYTATFNATGPSTKLQFADLGPPNTYGGFVDDVSLTNNTPVVSIVASDPDAVELGQDPGVFTVTVDRVLNSDLVVNYTIDGTADNGTDYLDDANNPLPASVTIPAGETSVTITVVPEIDDEIEGHETVTLTIVPFDLHEYADAEDNDNGGQDDFATIGDWTYVESSPAADGSYAGDGGTDGPDYTISDGSGDNTATSTHSTTGAGVYEVFVTWDESVGALGNATYEIYDDTTLIATIANVDQSAGPRNDTTDPRYADTNWHSLGEYTFTTSTPKVKLIEAGGGPVVADGFLLLDDSGCPSYLIDESNGSATVTIADAPVVSIVANMPNADELGPVNGEYTLSRTYFSAADLANPLSVKLDITGDATGNSDYRLEVDGVDQGDLSSDSVTVVIPANESSVVIVLIPVVDKVVEGDELATLTVVQDSPGSPTYVVADTPDHFGTVTIADAPTVSITATLPNADEVGPVDGEYTLTRSFNAAADLVNPLSVELQISGDATGSTDYRLEVGGVDQGDLTGGSLTVEIPANESSVAIALVPIPDAEIEGSENATLTVLEDSPGSPTYVVANNPDDTATVTIADAPSDIEITRFYSVDKQLTVDYTIHTNNLPSFDIQLYRDSVAGGNEMFGSVTVENLGENDDFLSPGNHTYTIDLTDSYITDGWSDPEEDYTLHVMLDDGDIVEETNEANNSARFEGGIFQVFDGEASGSQFILHVHGAVNAVDTVTVLGADAQGDRELKLEGPVNQTEIVSTGEFVEIHIRTHEEADTVSIEKKLTTTVWAFGGAANDSITTGLGDDRLHGGTGDDVLTGGGGGDHLYGSEKKNYGPDNEPHFDTGNADAHLKALDGDDNDPGNDELYGGTGDDRLYAGAGDDIVDGGAGADQIHAGPGWDTPEIIDNDQHGYSIVGGGEDDVTTLTENVAGFDGNYRDITDVLPANEQTKIWSFDDAPAGNYEVLVTWPDIVASGLGRSIFQVYDGNVLLREGGVNQLIAPVGIQAHDATWQSLGTYDFANTPSVQLLLEGSGDVVRADAVWLSPSTPYSLLAPRAVIENQDITLSADLSVPYGAGDASDPFGGGEVTFFHDTDGNGVLNASLDAVVGTDTDGSDGWSTTFDSLGYTVDEVNPHKFFAQVTSSKFISDEGDPAFATVQGNWDDGPAGLVGGDSLLNTPAVAGEAAEVSWTITGLTVGDTYDIVANWLVTAPGQMSTQVLYTADQGGVSSSVDQNNAPFDLTYTQGQTIGTFTAVANAITVTASRTSATDTGKISADAISVVRTSTSLLAGQPQVSTEVFVTTDKAAVDDSGFEFSTTGAAWDINNAVGYQGGHHEYLLASGTDGATWTFHDLPLGAYRAYVTYPSDAEQSTSVEYTLRRDNDHIFTTTHSHTDAPADLAWDNTNWAHIEDFMTDGGTISLDASHIGQGCTFAADGVLLVRLPYTIDIAVTDAYGYEGDTTDDIEFTVSRGEEHFTGNFNVHYALAAPDDLDAGDDGSAAATDGEDIESLVGTITILDGQSSATIVVTPKTDDDVEWDEAVKIGINGTDRSATAFLLDDDNIESKISRNTDVESTGAGDDYLGNGVVDVNIQEGAVMLSASRMFDQFTPIYNGDDNLHPIMAIEMELPENPDVLKAKFTVGGYRAPEVTFANIGDLAAGETGRFVLLGPDDLDKKLGSGNWEWDVQFTGTKTTGEIFNKTTRGTLEIVNRVDDDLGWTQFDKRWTIVGLDRVVAGDGITPTRSADTILADASFAESEFAASRLATQGAATEDGIALIRGDNSSAWYAATADTSSLQIADFTPGGGAWTLGTQVSVGSIEKGYNDSYYWTEDSADSAQWSFAGLDNVKRYQVFTTWTPNDDRTSEALYEVSGAVEAATGAEDKQIVVDQKFTPGEFIHAGHRWRSLGYYVPTGGSLDVSLQLLDEFSGGLLVADAVMLVEDWTYETPDGSFNDLYYGDLPGGVKTSLDLFADPQNHELAPRDGDLTLVAKYGNHYQFDEFGLLASTMDRNANRTEYTYTDYDGDLTIVDDLLTIETQGGLTWTVTADGTVLDFNNRVSEVQLGSYTYNSDDLLTNVTDLRGNNTIISYDANFRVNGVTNPDGESWQLTPFLVDGLSPAEVRSAVDVKGDGEAESFGSGNMVEPRATYTDGRGNEWLYQTDAYGHTTAMAAPATKDADGSNDRGQEIWRWNYHDDGPFYGLLDKSIQPAGGGGKDANLDELVTNYTYDTRGNVLNISYTDGSSETWTYDAGMAAGRVTSQVSTYTDAAGRVTTNTLDDMTGNVTATDENGVRTTKFENYTAAPTSIDDIAGGLVGLVTAADGTTDEVQTKFEYYGSSDGDKIGLQKILTEALGVTSTDPNEPDIEEKTYFDYDANRNLTLVTNDSTVAGLGGTALGDFERTVRYQYDALDRLFTEIGLATEDHGAPTTTYERYDDGLVKSITDAGGHKTEFEYDGMGRITLEKLPTPVGNPDSSQTRGETVFEYDANGNLEKEKVLTNSGYRETAHKHDERNQLIETRYAAPGYSKTDAHTLSGSEHVRPIIAYAYDALGNVKWEVDPRYGENATSSIRTEYTYDEIGQVETIESPRPEGAAADPVTTYAYYGDGQIQSVSTPGPNGTVTTSYSYDNLGRLKQEIRPNDGNGNQLTIDYTYDLRDNLKTQTESGGGASSGGAKTRTTTNYYDLRDRLIAVDGPDGSTDGVSQYLAYNEAGEVATQLVFAGDIDATYVTDKQITVAEIDAQRTAVWGRTDRNNIAQKTTINYDKLGRVLDTKGPDPTRGVEPDRAVFTKYTYDIRSNVKKRDAQADDFNGDLEWIITDVSYDELNRPWKTVTPGRPEMQVAYNVDGTTKHTKVETYNDNDNWLITSFGYDGLGRVLTQTSEDVAASGGTITTTAWRNALGNVTRTEDSFDLETHTWFGDAGERKQHSVQQAEAWVGNTSYENLYLQTFFEYNTAGLVQNQSQKASLNDTTTALETYGNGTTLVYDNLGRITKQTQQINANTNSITDFKYDVFGARWELDDPESNITTFTFDALGRMTQDSISFGNRAYEYDSFGNVLKSTDRNGKAIEFTYDNLGRRTQEDWVGDDYVADFSYTSFGELEFATNSDTDGDISEYWFFYDDSSRHLDQTHQLLSRWNDQEWIYFYYTQGDLINVTQVSADLPGVEHDYETTYDYDNQNRITEVFQESTPGVASLVNTKTITFEHDRRSRGNVELFTTFTRRYDGDSSGTPVASTKQNTYGNGTSDIIHHYEGDIPTDDTNNDFILNKTIKRDFLYYDARGLLIDDYSRQHDDNDAEVLYHTENEYDNYGQLIQVTRDIPGEDDPDPTLYAYDANGNPISNTVVGGHNRLLQNLQHTYTYDAEGNVASRWDYETEVTGTEISDEQLSTAGNVTLSAGEYRLDLVNVRFEDQPNLDWDETYTIEAKLYINDTPPDTLLSTQSIEIEWDSGISKWVIKDPDAVWFDVATDFTNDMYIDFNYTSISNNPDPDLATGSRFVISELSQLQEFEWDHRGRLESVTIWSETSTVNEKDVPNPGGGMIEVGEHSPKHYQYDALGQLIHSYLTSAGSTTKSFERYYVLERGRKVFFDNDGTEHLILPHPQANYDLAEERNSTNENTMWPLHNRLGTAVAAYAKDWSPNAGDEDAEVFKFDELGQPDTNNASLSSRLTHLNAGREFDSFTDLYQNRARWYDPSSGRFISTDPIGFAGGDTNLYRYVGNSFGNATDPSGNAANLVAGAIGAVAGRSSLAFAWTGDRTI